MSEEPPKAQPPTKNGHPDFLYLAAIMAGDEDVTIFRRFDELNVLNLLVLQDELHSLNEQLMNWCQPRHDNSQEIPQNYLASYILGQSHSASQDTTGRNQTITPDTTELQETLRGKLKEYSEPASTFRVQIANSSS